jgi:mono/diheme cytochrome c family protein
MRYLFVCTLNLALALALCACEKDKKQAGVEGADPEAGRVLAERYCQSCHAVGPEGTSSVVAAPPFREIVKRFPPEDLQEALAEGIQVSHKGVVQMPEVTLDPDQVDDFIAYLKTLQTK